MMPNTKTPQSSNSEALEALPVTGSFNYSNSNIDQDNRIDVSDFVRMAIDAEWYTTKGRTSFLTKQFTFLDDRLLPQLTIILWNQDYTLPIRLPNSNHPIVIIPCDVQQTTLADVCKLPSSLRCYMYYSPKDVEAMVGREVWKAILLDPKKPVRKQRNLTGEFKHQGTTYALRDCFGAFNTSLENAMLSVGVDNPYKGNVEHLGYTKDQMNKFMETHPNEFLEYAFGDTAFLGETLVKRVEQVNTIIRDALGNGVIQYTIDTFPTSSGSLVARTFQSWLMTTYPNLYRGLLALTDCNDNTTWQRLQALKDTLAQDENLTHLDKQMAATGFVHGLAMGSIRNYPLIAQGTGVFGSVVMGGRCVNEEPHKNLYENRLSSVVDIDLSSCYGSALKDFDYPIGIPTIWENRRDDQPATLREFLSKRRSELVPGLYTIYVRGILSFDQDLIHSKYGLSTEKIQRTILNDSFDSEMSETVGREIEPAHIGGEFLLTTRQIENGIITSEVLKTIEAVASSRELGELMGLEVVTVVYYPKGQEMSVDDWTTHHQNPSNLGGKYRGKGDTRSRLWCRIPLTGFINNFITYRKEVKKQSVLKGDSHDLLQNAVKLFINTTYGDLASPYFPMGNTVLANNITAKARVGVWMMSKALLTVQSITDGGMFSWRRVLSIKAGGKRPSLNTLANRQRLLEYRYTETKPLTDRDVWEWMRTSRTTEGRELDKLCLDHINNFWSAYGLVLPFAIECKYENTAREAVYFGSSDYLLSETVDGRKEVIKCRGAKNSDNPKQEWLRHLLNPSTTPVPKPHYKYPELVGVKEYQEAGGLGVFQDTMPGEEITRNTWHRPYTNGELYPTWYDHKRMNGRKRKAVSKHEQTIREGGDTAKDTAYFGLAKDAVNNKYRPL